MRRNRSLKHKTHTASPWYLLAAASVCGLICIYSLRQNNLNMVYLRTAVFTADQNNGNVEGTLKNLQKYIFGHMNTNLNTGSSVHPPIQLKYTYERLVKAEKDRVSTANAPIYIQAQTACRQQIPPGFSGHIPCIDEYVASHGGATEQAIPASLYQFDFVSPVWTPDLAGWSLVATIVLFGLFCVRYVLRHIVRHQIKQQL